MNNTNDLKVGDKLQTTHMRNKVSVVVIKEIHSDGMLLIFKDGSEALFPMRYILRDFKKVQNG